MKIHRLMTALVLALLMASASTTVATAVGVR